MSTDPNTEAKPRGKGAPTPSRAEREAARKRPLVPNDRKEAAKRERARIQQERLKARIGMANGDERYLSARDRGPQRKWVRDFVDARFSLGEFMLIMMLAFVLLSAFIPQSWAANLLLGMYLYLLMVVVDSVVLSISMRRALERKFGKGSMQKGTRYYAVMRSLQFRKMRIPKPVVRYFRFPD